MPAAKYLSALGLFRILYGAILFCEVAQTFLVSVVYPYDISPLFLSSWLIVIACLIVGWHTRVAAILNYALTLVAYQYTPLHYHADYIYLMVNLILTVAPVSQRLSVDARLWPDLMHGEV